MPRTRAQRDAGKETMSAIRYLWNEWDPIGVASSALVDEYDSYLARTFDLLDSDSSEDVLTDYLTYLVRDYIGLGATGVEHSQPREFARTLQAWYKSRKDLSDVL